MTCGESPFILKLVTRLLECSTKLSTSFARRPSRYLALRLITKPSGAWGRNRSNPGFELKWTILLVCFPLWAIWRLISSRRYTWHSSVSAPLEAGHYEPMLDLLHKTPLSNCGGLAVSYLTLSHYCWVPALLLWNRKRYFFFIKMAIMVGSVFISSKYIRFTYTPSWVNYKTIIPRRSSCDR